MGRLVKFEQLEPDPSWYFQGAHYYPNAKPFGTWRCDLEKENLPLIYIHNDVMTRDKKIEVRRWVESNLTETVVQTYRDMTYHYFHEYEGRKKYDSYTYTQTHGYYAFIFESNEAAVMFKLTFGDVCVEEPDWLHPDHVGEENLRTQRQGSYKYWNGLRQEVDDD